MQKNTRTVLPMFADGVIGVLLVRVLFLDPIEELG